MPNARATKEIKYTHLHPPTSSRAAGRNLPFRHLIRSKTQRRSVSPGSGVDIVERDRGKKSSALDVPQHYRFSTSYQQIPLQFWDLPTRGICRLSSPAQYTNKRVLPFGHSFHEQVEIRGNQAGRIAITPTTHVISSTSPHNLIPVSHFPT